MENEVHLNPGLGRRLDLLAVTNPRAIQRSVWIFGLLAVWALTGVASSAVARQWSIAAISSGTVVLAGSMWWVTLRAKRRAPETKRWLEEQSR